MKHVREEASWNKTHYVRLINARDSVPINLNIYADGREGERIGGDGF